MEAETPKSPAPISGFERSPETSGPERPSERPGTDFGALEPVLGAAQSEGVIRRVNALEELQDVRELRPFLAREGQ